MTTITALSSEAAEILEPNLQFFRSDPSDKTRYMVGPEVLQAISWTATTIALPLLMVGLSEVVKTYVKRWMEKKEAQEVAAPPPDDVSREIDRLLSSPTPLLITEAQSEVAVEVVADFLAYRGWPKAFATADATMIVNTIMEKIGITP